LLFQEQFIKTPFNIKINTHILTDAISIENTKSAMNKTYSTIALAKTAMERIPLHSWEMEFSIQYHVRDHA
jgi:hypothetical protein